ncbi:hypothetical protein [Bradyrhizobium ottawaense]|uniref:hypothetical protein n=1 Tax=Bradyrhizobium ottawaense TaxID=931866 RepID=UPI00384D5E7F
MGNVALLKDIEGAQCNNRDRYESKRLSEISNRTISKEEYAADEIATEEFDGLGNGAYQYALARTLQRYEDQADAGSEREEIGCHQSAFFFCDAG